MKEADISYEELSQLAKLGKSQSEIASHFGVNRSTICKKMKRLGEKITADVAMRSAPGVVRRELNVVDQVHKINGVINRELDRIASELAKVGEPVKRGEKKKPPVDVSALRDQQIRHVAEIRKQCSLMADILRQVYDMAEFIRFRDSVLEEIGSVDESTRKKIIDRLIERGNVASTFTWPGLAHDR